MQDRQQRSQAAGAAEKSLVSLRYSECLVHVKDSTDGRDGSTQKTKQFRYQHIIEHRRDQRSFGRKVHI